VIPLLVFAGMLLFYFGTLLVAPLVGR